MVLKQTDRIRQIAKNNWPVLLVVVVVAIIVARDMLRSANAKQALQTSGAKKEEFWIAPSLHRDNQTTGKQRQMIIYGQQLIASTATYLGPKGSVSQSSNGMNCQNCHLDAGTRIWGNNYGGVASTYPKYRERSGSVETIARRVNDCMQRSLNGRPLDTTSYEMQSIVAYISWLGQSVPAGEKPKGSGIKEVPFLNRPASPLRGKKVYQIHCVECHGKDGQGTLYSNGVAYEYPPLWGPRSYNTGAGLFRLSRFAGYVQNNMPYNLASYKQVVLSNEQAWDVAAFVNSQPRPVGNFAGDWPNIAAKPFDHPFGPFADGFSEQQHKYGPFLPIIQKKKAAKRTPASKQPVASLLNH